MVEKQAGKAGPWWPAQRGTRQSRVPPEKLVRVLQVFLVADALPDHGVGRPKTRGVLGTLLNLTCSGGMNPPCAEVFASGENARTALARRPIWDGAPVAGAKRGRGFAASPLEVWYIAICVP